MADTIVTVNTGYITRIDEYLSRIWVRPDTGGTDIDMDIHFLSNLQAMPMEQDKVQFITFADHHSIPLHFSSSRPDRLRYFNNALVQGETQIGGVGGSYILFDAAGNISLVEGSMAGSIRLNNEEREIDIEHSRIVLRCFPNSKDETKFISITIDQESKSVSIENGFTDAIITMDEDGTSVVDQKMFSVVAPNIYLDGDVYLGNGASDDAARSLFGDVVTGGVNGTYPLDYLTNLPINGSSQVKAGK